MSETRTIKLPTGLTIVQGELKITSLDKLFSSKGSQFTGNLLGLLGDCTQGVEDPCVYSANGAYDEDKLNWLLTYDGDWMTALIELVIDAHGEEYEFKAQCPACRDRFEHEVNLRKLRTKSIPEETLEVLMGGKNVVYRDSSIGKIGIRIPTGKENILFDKSQKLIKGKNKDVIKKAIAFKVVSVEGIDNLNKWRETINVKLASEIFDLIEEVSFGTDSEIEIECPYCDHLWDFNIPFDKNFFLRRRTKKR